MGIIFELIITLGILLGLAWGIVSILMVIYYGRLVWKDLAELVKLFFKQGSK